MMPKYRKKPTVVEAIQFDGSIECADRIAREYGSDVFPDTEADGTFIGHLAIATQEGRLIAFPGEWIITDANGDRYPCNDEFFRLNYEEIA